jgi:hypothetical protein
MCDMDEFKSPNILFLKGVYMRNCKDVDDIMEDRLAEMVGGCDSVNTSHQASYTYNKIPRLFIDVDTWPTHTNLLCFRCNCSFAWSPVFVPESINPSDTCRGVYKPIVPIGNFCTFICANMYIKKMYIGSERWEKIELLKMLHSIMTNGKTISDIIDGPEHTEMEQYGGSTTTCKFQSKLKALCIQCNIVFPPDMFAPALDDYKPDESD